MVPDSKSAYFQSLKGNVIFGTLIALCSVDRDVIRNQSTDRSSLCKTDMGENECQSAASIREPEQQPKLYQLI